MARKRSVEKPKGEIPIRDAAAIEKDTALQVGERPLEPDEIDARKREKKELEKRQKRR